MAVLNKLIRNKQTERETVGYIDSLVDTDSYSTQTLRVNPCSSHSLVLHAVQMIRSDVVYHNVL